MSLYRVLLVDDEEEIREGIIQKIDWEGCGFQLVGGAENGKEALEMAERLRPDLVMADIKMPFMDGLELCRILAERMPTMKRVIFSGFDDFEYAQQAIKMNVTEYILKPINAAELTEMLGRLRAQMDREIDERRNVERLEEYYRQSLPILREQFLNGLVESRFATESAKDIIARATRYGLQIDAGCWSVAVARADDVGEGSPLAVRELRLLSAQKVIEEHLERFGRFYSFLYGDSVTVVAMLPSPHLILEFVERLDQVCKIAQRLLGFHLAVGVGPVCHELPGLHSAYLGALRAVDYRVLTGTDQAIYIDDMEPSTTAPLNFEEQDERRLSGAIKLGTPEEIKEVVDSLIGRFGEHSGAGLSFNQYQIYLMEMLAVLINLARAYRLELDEVFGEGFQGYAHLADFDSLKSLSAWFYDSCLHISTFIKRERLDAAKLTVEKAKAFVQENYHNTDISVEMLCNHLHMSPAYFSTVFKREAGVSFINYLTDVRMDQAVKLLNSTEEKTYAISALVGYTEPNYFSYVFKKRFGVSPSKYRK